MNVRQIRRWAFSRGLNHKSWHALLDEAFLIAVSRLFQAFYREQYPCPTRLTQAPEGDWFVVVGENPTVEVRTSGPLPFKRIEVTDYPRFVQDGKAGMLRNALGLLFALRPCIEQCTDVLTFVRLKADFRNSLANLIINRVLFISLNTDSPAPEPAFEGHHYYPFPALRIGPSIEQIEHCSHLSHYPVDLRVLSSPTLRIEFAHKADHRTFMSEWSGLKCDSSSPVCIPIHPWQLDLSDVVKDHLRLGLLTWSGQILPAMPLASQRTCRIVATGYDVKLPVHATLTGEHRLLYRINVVNAPMVSHLANLLLTEEGPGTLRFQIDLASIFHDDRRFAPHISAIIRAPVIADEDESIVPAINIWTGLKLARCVFSIHSTENAYALFDRYCRVLFEGPLYFYARWGFAVEPHLQNVLVRIRDHRPAGIVIRDLDSSIMDVGVIPEIARRRSVRFASLPWDVMPTIVEGGSRLMHATFYGHLGQVMSFLAHSTAASQEKMGKMAMDIWEEMAALLTPRYEREISNLRSSCEKVKRSLTMRLARSMTMEFG